MYFRAMKRLIYAISAVSLFLRLAQPVMAQQDAANVGARLLQDAAIKNAVDAMRAVERQTASAAARRSTPSLMKRG